MKEPRRRRALLLGCSEFTDPTLPSLGSPATDVRELAAVLGDPNGSDYQVITQINIAAHEAQLAIDQFLDAANTQDLHLIYFSGHGIQDARGNLFFAFTNTKAKLPSSTAVSADWLRERMNTSRSKSTVILIDCCFSGLFLRAMRSRAGGDANVGSLVGDLPEGSGIAVLTASGETEFSLEDINDDPGLSTRPSYFTEAVLTGISTGAADTDRDGRITVDELYEYVYARVKAGPSPQRPRRMGYGEGHVVVALTARRAAEPMLDTPHRSAMVGSRAGPPKPALPARPDAPRRHATAADWTAANPPTVVVDGILGSVAFDGTCVTVTKTGLGSQMNGSVQLPIDQISAVHVKPATTLFYGYIQFVVRNHPVAPIVRAGLAAGRPHREDPLSMSFARKRNGAIADFQKQVASALPFPTPLAPQAQGPSPAVRTERVRYSGTARLALRPGQDPTTEDALAALAPGVPSQRPPLPVVPNSAASAPTLPAVAADSSAAWTQADARLAEQRRGHADGAASAERIPLHAWVSLVASGYDVVQWIAPWRVQWESIEAGNASPDPRLASWLPTMEHHLEGSTAAAEAGALLTNYIESFVAGVRETWHAAVRDHLLPPTPQAFEAWLRSPAQPHQIPPALLTIADLRASAKRAKRSKTWIMIMRILLWILTALLALFEIATIVISVTGSWNPNNTSSQVIGNLMCSVPLAVLVIALVFDARRTKTRSRPPGPGTK